MEAEYDLKRGIHAKRKYFRNGHRVKVNPLRIGTLVALALEPEQVLAHGKHAYAGEHRLWRECVAKLDVPQLVIRGAHDEVIGRAAFIVVVLERKCRYTGIGVRWCPRIKYTGANILTAAHQVVEQRVHVKALAAGNA